MDKEDGMMNSAADRQGVVQNAEGVRRQGVHKYLTDPRFHAQVETGARAIMALWEARSVLNQGLDDGAWREAKILAFEVLTAAEATPLDGSGDAKR